MKRWIFVLFLCVAYSTVLRGEPFERAEVTKTVNLVSLLPQATQAVPGDVIKGDSALKTGGDSRAELQFPDLTIARVGSNALFRFIAGARAITLDGGTMLFSSPKGAGGGTVQAGAITAAVTGSDFLIANAGRVKVICLSHKVLVYFTANPKMRVVLRPGQMVDIAGGATKMPPVTTINLAVLLSTSMLCEAGGFGPLPGQATLELIASKQAKGFVAANDPLLGNANLQTQAAQAAQAAQTARSTAVANNNPSSQFAAQAARTVPSTTAAQTVPSTAVANNNPPSQFAAQAARTVPSTTAANNNPSSQLAAAPTATGSPPDTTSNGTGGSRGNNSNIRNIENRGNSGNAPGRAGR